MIMGLLLSKIGQTWDKKCFLLALNLCLFILLGLSIKVVVSKNYRGFIMKQLWTNVVSSKYGDLSTPASKMECLSHIFRSPD